MTEGAVSGIRGDHGCGASTPDLTQGGSGGTNREIYMAKHSAQYITGKWTKQQTTGENPQEYVMSNVVSHTLLNNGCLNPSMTRQKYACSMPDLMALKFAWKFRGGHKDQ